jgi:hypothetical protein
VAAQRPDQREYCAAQGLSLKAFGNWRAKIKSEPQPAPRKLLWRHSGASHSLSHIVSHTLSHGLSHVTYPSSATASGPIERSTLAGWVGGACWWLEPLRIAELYAVDRRIRGQSAEVRRMARRAASQPLTEAMRPWLEEQLRRLPPRGGLADAIRYAFTRWEALCRFLDDGRIELDNNPVERAIRPVALGRKNHLFAGSDGGGECWALIVSLIETAKLNSVEPYAYLKDVLERSHVSYRPKSVR